MAPPIAEAATAQDASTPLVHTRALDHVNLHVRDADAALRFYTEMLGLTVDHVDRDDQGRATLVVLHAGAQHVFLMRRPHYQVPADRNDRGLNHVCVEIAPTDPAQLLSQLHARGVSLRSELVHRQSARGPSVSIYVEDLDGHGIEIKQYVTG
jgi:catechol 2,3-dioxygenase-like lactoylglutathione lyase family enzyme